MKRLHQAQAGSDDVEILPGALVNAGRIRRVGECVVRPAGEHTPSVHALLRHVRQNGFWQAPEPLAVEDGEERLTYIPGLVAHYPYEDWVKSDSTLCQVASLLRRFHDATQDFVVTDDARWSEGLADPQQAPPQRDSRSLSDQWVICHNDVLHENVVFKEGRAVGLLDFDFAAPGRRIWDVARAVMFWLPLDDPEAARSYHLGGLDPFTRLPLFLNAYGLEKPARALLLDVIDTCTAKSEAYVRGQVEAGKPAFVELWNNFHIEEIYRRKRGWLADNRERLASALAL